MEFLIWALVVVLLGLGFYGCFVNKVPGPVFVVIATAVAKFGTKMDLGWDSVAIVTVLAIVSMILSKQLVKKVKQFHSFSKRGARGTTLGSIIGLLVVASLSSKASSLGILIVSALIGLVVLPFVFAFLFELTLKAGMEETKKCAFAATGAYLADTCLKLVVFVFAVRAMFM